MKTAAAGLLFALLAAAAAQTTPDGATPDPLVVQRRTAMVLRQSTKLYEAGEYQAALDRLAALQGQAGQDLSVLNLRGAILTKMKQYDEARRIFESILATDPSFFPAAYNMGEAEFLSGNYDAATEAFDGMLRRDPRNELVRFKLVLCALAAGREEEAQRLAGALLPAGNTPAWYYAQAVFARRAGDEAKARKNLAAARALHGEEGCRLFDESLAALPGG